MQGHEAYCSKLPSKGAAVIIKNARFIVRQTAVSFLHLVPHLVNLMFFFSYQDFGIEQSMILWRTRFIAPKFVLYLGMKLGEAYWGTSSEVLMLRRQGCGKTKRDLCTEAEQRGRSPI